MEQESLEMFADLYEFTMAQAYFSGGMSDIAVFELSFRAMPACRNFMVAAGVNDVADFAAGYHLKPSAITYLRSLGSFGEDFLARLRSLRFSGDVYAVPEGSIVFAQEPILQVRAPIAEAQLLETFALNQVHFQSMVATKALRFVEAAAGRNTVDFGSRRAHGIDAGLKAARAFYLAGGNASSNLLAGLRYGIPVAGTMAHSFIQAHEKERTAYEAFARIYPGATMLVDTYDTRDGVNRLIAAMKASSGTFHVQAVRLDSGDLAVLSRQVRRQLDDAGFTGVGIFVSGGLDEYRVRDLVEQRAPIDGFAAGTKTTVIDDAPLLDMAYKLVEYGGIGRLKLSESKRIFPGQKQIFRKTHGGCMVGDIIGRADESNPGEPLLQPLVTRGNRCHVESLQDCRNRLRCQVQMLPAALRRLESAAVPYPTSWSPAIQQDLISRQQEVCDAQRS